MMQGEQGRGVIGIFKKSQPKTVHNIVLKVKAKN